MSQYKLDELRFADLLSKFTGIGKTRIDEFLKNNPVNNIFEHTASIGATSAQRERLEDLRELRNLYTYLKQGADKMYVMNDNSKAGAYFKAYFEDIKDKERFVCSFLNSQNQVIATKVLNVGTVNEAPVYPREIVKEALLNDAAAVILAHNHPGGSDKPSSADIDVTDKIMSALKAVNIRVLDHIIVAADEYCSFAEKGLLNGSTVFSNSLREIDESNLIGQQVLSLRSPKKKFKTAHGMER